MQSHLHFYQIVKLILAYQEIYINNSNVGEKGRNKILGNFIGTTKKKKWINESYAQPNDNNHLKINTKDLIRTPTFPPLIHI